MENYNIGYIGSEGTNQYSNPYQSDYYTKPSERTENVAEENIEAQQKYLTNQSNIGNQPNIAIQPDPRLENQTYIAVSPSPTSQEATNNRIPTAPPLVETIDIVEGPLTPVEQIQKNSTNKLNKRKSRKTNTMDIDNRQNRTSSDFLLYEEGNIEKKNTNIPIDEEDEEEYTKPPGKYRICCCPLWVCIAITVAILAFIGIMLFIFWPKIPHVDIENIELSQPTGGKSSIRYEIPTIANGEQGGIELDLDVNIKVNNENFYNINVHKIEARIYIQTNDMGKTYVGQGFKSDINFKKHSITDFTLPVTIAYYMDGGDSTLIYLLKACARNTPINIQYEVDIGLPVLDIVYKPTVQGTETFYCPENGVTSGDISSVLMGDIYSSITDYLSNFVGI